MEVHRSSTLPAYLKKHFELGPLTINNNAISYHVLQVWETCGLLKTALSYTNLVLPEKPDERGSFRTVFIGCRFVQIVRGVLGLHPDSLTDKENFDRLASCILRVLHWVRDCSDEVVALTCMSLYSPVKNICLAILGFERQL